MLHRKFVYRPWGYASGYFALFTALLTLILLLSIVITVNASVRKSKKRVAVLHSSTDLYRAVNLLQEWKVEFTVENGQSIYIKDEKDLPVIRERLYQAGLQLNSSGVNQ